MQEYLVEVVGRRFLVNGDEIDGVRQLLVAAAKAGGEFVTLGSGDSRREVLITPGLPVTIQRRDEDMGVFADDPTGASTMGALVTADDQFDEWGI